MQSEQLRAAALQLEGEREITEQLVVTQERQRMADELHDTIAHAVSIMVVQAGGAEQMVSQEPDRARSALIAVQDNGREVISQLQRVLQLLRGARDTARLPTVKSLPTPVPGWWKRQPITHLIWADAVLALCVILFADPQLTHIDRLDRIPVEIAVSALPAFLAIMIRRRFPFTALLIATTTTAVGLQLFGVMMGFSSIVAAMLAMYSVAAHAVALRSVPAAVTAVVATSIVVALNVGDIGAVVIFVVWLGVPWFCGRLVRSYRSQAEQLRTLTTRLARERDARARLAILDERARVARELHDSLAHAVNVMVLQAGAAEQLLTSTLDRAKEAIRVVEAHGRQAHNDLEQLLGLLSGAETSPRAPQPSLSRLDALFAEAGLPVTLHVSGSPSRLPADMDVSAFRIVQEALTNTLKHVGVVPTTVTLDYRPDALGVEIRNPRAGRSSAPHRQGGHGHLGMRERTALYGGSLETGPGPDGGFVVRARFPLAPAVT